MFGGTISIVRSGVSKFKVIYNRTTNNYFDLLFTRSYSIMPPKRKAAAAAKVAVPDEEKHNEAESVPDINSKKTTSKRNKKNEKEVETEPKPAVKGNKKTEMEPKGKDLKKRANDLLTEVPKESKRVKRQPPKATLEENDNVAEEDISKKSKITRGKQQIAVKAEDSDSAVEEDIPKKPKITRGKQQIIVEAEDNESDSAAEIDIPKTSKITRGKRQIIVETEGNESDSAAEVDIPKKSKITRRKQQIDVKPEDKKPVNKSEEKGNSKVSVRRKQEPLANKANGDSDKQFEDEEVPTTSHGKQAAPKTLLNETETAYNNISFACKKPNKEGKQPNFCISSWNVDGLRAWIKKQGLKYIKHEKPNVFCIQESKCSIDKLPPSIKDLDEYKQYWHNGTKEGYAGVGLFSLIEPLSVKYGIGEKENDEEGRCVTAEFDKFYVISVYVPNAGRKLVTLPKRLEWNVSFKKFVKNLDKKKPVIICGDMNVAHTEIDLANPKTNTKNAGYSIEERDGMTDFLADGYIDTFRSIYPDKKDAYTFWSYMSKARAKNVGWRLDYFIVSQRFLNTVCDNVIRNEVFGSDHCPIALFLNV